MNKVFLIGNLTRDPEPGTTSSGINYSRFSIAVNRRFSKDNEVDYFNIVAWRGLADVCNNNLSKGRKVSVIGSIQIRSYEGNDGTKRTAVEITAEDIEFLSSANRSDNGDSEPAPAKKEKDITKLKPVEEELPF